MKNIEISFVMGKHISRRNYVNLTHNQTFLIIYIHVIQTLENVIWELFTSVILRTQERKQQTIYKRISRLERINYFFLFYLTDNCNHLLSKTNTWFFKGLTYDILLLFFFFVLLFVLFERKRGSSLGPCVLRRKAFDVATQRACAIGLGNLQNGSRLAFKLLPEQSWKFVLLLRIWKSKTDSLKWSKKILF